MKKLTSQFRILGVLGALCLGITPAFSQCGVDNSDCIGSDCIPATSAGAGNVEYALGDSKVSSSDGKLLFNSFKQDTGATGTNNGTTTTNTNAAFVRGGGESIKHTTWSAPKRAEISDLAFNHPIRDPNGEAYFYWYGWSYFIPDDSKWGQTINPAIAGDQKLRQYIGQWRFSNLSGCATMRNGNNTSVGGSGHHLQYREGRLFFTMTLRDEFFTTVNRMRQVEFDLGPAAKGVWMDFMIQAKWTSGNSGVFNLWLQKNNGGYTQLVDYTGPTWFTYNLNSSCSYSGQPAGAPNWQVGMYWSNDAPLSSSPRTLYSDEIRMRRSLCPTTIGSDAWDKTRPASGSVNAPSLVPALHLNPIEMEKLAYTTSSGDAATNTSNSLASASAYIRFNGAAVGDFLQTTVYAPFAAAYRITLRGLTASNGATADLSVNGTSVGAWNQNAATGAFTEHDYATVNLNRGHNTFRWQLSATGGSSSSYNLDWMKLEGPGAGAKDLTGTWRILGKSSGKSLRPAGGALGDNVNIVLFPYASTWTNLHWTLLRQADGFYEIRNVASQKLLRPSGGSLADNAQIVQFTDNNLDTQRWQIIDAGDGFYKIKNRSSGKLLSPQGGASADNTTIVQLPDDARESQLWFVGTR